MREVADGDVAAFTELFERHKHDVVNFLHRHCGDHGRAEDFAQECFLRVYRGAADYRPGGKFKGWLLMIAINVCRSQVGKTVEKVRHVQMAPELVATESRAGKGLEETEMRAAVQKALSDIPEEQREVIVLRHFRGMKFTEIAAMLSCPVETVKSRMHYGMLKLLDLLKDRGCDV
jgi:RNA polymerase sigma factor (sigma-70 family)